MKIAPIFRRHDWFSLIPRWTFFAPNPGTTDYHLLYRDKSESVEFSAWKEYPLQSKRSLLGSIWNPEKRTRKVLSDAVQSLVRMSNDLKPHEYKITISYLALINFIASLSRSNHAESTQFLIMESYGFDSDKEPKLLFRSEFHKLS